jgi:hypothetical protein
MRVLLVAACTMALLTGCGQEAICGGDDYPVKAVGNTTGATCVPEGQDPPEGYVRYPAGQEPKHVGDKWDKYWQTKIVDSSGKIVSG